MCTNEDNAHTQKYRVNCPLWTAVVVKTVCVLSCIEYGGLGLDFSYSVAVAEELGNIRCGGIPMAIGVQSDMATPALARYNSTNITVHV